MPVSVFFSLTRNTFRECLREPVFFLILASTLLLVLSFPLFTFFAFDRQIWTILESSMAAVMFLGFAAAVICTNSCVQREMKNGTLLLLLSKPVSRFTFLLAKVTGITGAMIVFSVICCTAVMTVVLASISPFLFDAKVMLSFFGVCILCLIFGAARNYFTGASFTENTIFALLPALPAYYAIFYSILQSRLGRMDSHDTVSLTFVNFSEQLPVMLLLLLAIVLMGIITTATALHFSFLSNLVFCTILFLGGLLVGPWSQALFGSESFRGDLFSTLLPNWQLFWMAYPVSEGTAIPLSYAGWMTLYVIAYGMIWVIWAGVTFQCTELAKDSRV